MAIRKVGCRVNRKFDGVLELHEHELRPSDNGRPCFAVWYGLLNLVGDVNVSPPPLGVPLLIEMPEEGTAAEAYLIQMETEEYVSEDEQTVNCSCLMSVFGLTPYPDLMSSSYFPQLDSPPPQ